MFKNLHNEKGMATVEATFIFPMMILITISLYFASMFAYERAALQAGVEKSAVLYKNSYTDDYIDIADSVTYTTSDDMVVASNYNTQGSVKALNPYDGIFMSDDGNMQTKLKNGLFKSLSGYLFYGDTLNISVSHENYIIYKSVTVTATETVKIPLNLSLIGIKNEYQISASATAFVNDNDEFMRDVDLVTGYISHSKIGDKLQSIFSKVKTLYDKFRG